MLLLLLSLACTSPPPPVDVAFVRGGAVVRGADEGRPLGAEGWRFVPRVWTAGEAWTVAGKTFTAPERAECVTAFSVALGDVRRHIGAGGEPPDTDLAFSPDGATLAIGTWTGDLLLVDAWTGETRARRHLGEALIKRVAWSPDGATLYAAEQSPDATLRALDPATLTDRWTARLADHVGSSPPPAAADLYGAYQLPTAFDLLPAADGVIVDAAHGWSDAEGHRQNRSQLLRFNTEGALVAAWPEAPAQVIFQAARRSEALVAVTVQHTADAPPDLPPGAIALIDLAHGGLTLRALVPLPPQGALFPKPWIWQAFDLRAGALLTGFGDGRVQVRDALTDGAPLRVDASPGVPEERAGVPIAASVGFGALTTDSAVAVTSGTTVPFGAASAESQPPVPHPGASTVFGWPLAGGAPWTWRGEVAPEGLVWSAARHEMVIGGGRRQGDQRRDLFGAVVLDDRADATTRLLATCRTAAPVFFRLAVADDGRIAVVEHPWLTQDGEVAGAWQVTVLR